MVKIKINQLRETLVELLIKKEFSLEEAKFIAEEYIEGELQNKISHGLMVFPLLLKNLGKNRKKNTNN
ncbi:MAG: hypothetical protein ABIJ05_03025 [Patescibacteria group bacterium]